MQIQMSDRALRKFEKTPDKGFIAREIVRLSDALEGMRLGELPHGNIKTLSGPIRQRAVRRGLALAEWKMSVRSRMVFDTGSTDLKIVDFAASDTHTVVEQLDALSNSAFVEVLSRINPVPDWVNKIIDNYATVDQESSFEVFLQDKDESEDRTQFIEQRFNDWIRFLDHDQVEVRDSIIRNLTFDDGFGLHILLGGPGTGKTMVLLDLAYSHALYSDDAPSLILPAGVRHYVQSLDPATPGLGDEYGDGVILLDDPETFDRMRDVVELAKEWVSQLLSPLTRLSGTSGELSRNFTASLKRLRTLDTN